LRRSASDKAGRNRERQSEAGKPPVMQTALHGPFAFAGREAKAAMASLSEITAQRGITLDAEVVDACRRAFNEGGGLGLILIIAVIVLLLR